MAYAQINNVRIAGVASCVPKNVVSNLDCAPELRAERERLVRNIGIEKRRIADANVCLSDLTQAAAEKLMSDLGWAPDEIDALVVVTQSPDYSYPGNGVLLQHRLGLSQSCLSFDINLGCSGYPYGLFVLSSMMAAGKLKKALLLVGDKSTNPNSEDHGFVVLFSDAGTATALEYDETAPPVHFDLNSDGSGYQAIYCPAGGNRSPIKSEHLVPRPNEDGVIRRAVDIVLDGPAILNFSITRIPQAINDLLELADVSKEEIDFFFLHQANRMINETIRKKLRLTPEQTPSTLRDFGNTSSASIPVTMTVRAASELAAGGKKVLMSGFGVGLSWASCIYEMGPTTMSALVEI